MAVKKGQMFVLAALIFSSLLLLVAFSYDDMVQNNEESNVKGYFELAKEEHVRAFNHALRENYSSQAVEKEIYSTERFILRRARSKGIDYSSVDVFILPEKGNLTLINYQESSLEPEIKIEDKWYNITVGDKQKTTISFSPEPKTVEVKIESFDIDRTFTAYNPRLLSFLEMETGDELWRSTTLH